MLLHFEIELADVDRGVYETLDFRIVQHPSETLSYLLTRAFAFALSYQEGLEFSPAGLGDPDVPALQAAGRLGAIAVWIEIGNPSAKKLHKASKAAEQVIVYTYKNPEVLVKEISENNVHRSNELQIFSLDSKFLQGLEKLVQKNNRWSLLFQQGQLDVSIGDQTFTTELKRHQV